MHTTLQKDRNKYLFNTLDWFNENVVACVCNAVKTYLEADFDVTLVSLTDNETIKSDFISKGEIYFTTQIPSTTPGNIAVRLSSEFVRLFLHNFFGSNLPTFKLVDMSELEIKILNNFSEFVYKGLESVLIPEITIQKEKIKGKGFYNLTFLIEREEFKPTKIVVSIPKNRIRPEEIEKCDNFVFEDFLKLQTFVNITVGTSKIALNDLKNLYLGDIILLENSKTNTMELKAAKIKKTFKVNPDPSLMIELDEDEDSLGDETLDNKNMWDDIQIEVSAEFDKVKMSLGELKQIGKGLVIDLGPLLHNKISLLVENKAVAYGELVIINDKYGVRIDEVVSSSAKVKAQEPVQRQIETAEPQPVSHIEEIASEDHDAQVQQMAQESGHQEEFDYSDFENEDS